MNLLEYLTGELLTEQSLNFGLLVLKFTVLVVGVLLCHRFCHRCSAAFKHFLLGFGVVGAMLLLLLHFNTPAWSVELPMLVSASESTLSIEQPQQGNNSIESKLESLGQANGLPRVVGQSGNPDTAAYGVVANDGTVSNDHNEEARPNSPSKVVVLPRSRSAHWIESVTLSQWLMLAWSSIALVMLARIIIAWIYVARKVRAATESTADQLASWSVPLSLRDLIQQRKARLFVSDTNKQMPLGFGLLRKSILLPANCREWDSAQWHSVLQHEMAHFDRGDCWVNLFARIQQALFWFHPLSTTLVRKLREESELACDDRVLAAGVSKTDYATVLLQIATSGSRSKLNRVVAVSMADSIPLQSRMESILSESASRRPVSMSSGLGMLLLGAAMLFPMATGGVFLAAVADEADVIQPQELAEEEAVFNVSLKPTGDEVSYGGEFIGTLDESLVLTTEAKGEVTIDADDIRSLRPYRSDNKQVRIQTLDDEILVGELNEVPLKFSVAKSISGDHGNQKEMDADKVFLISRVEKAEAIPGTITAGTAKSKLTYHMRVPVDFDEDSPLPALFLMGQNGSYSKSHVTEFVARWPELAERFVLVGVNGERPSPTSNLAYSFTSLSYVGKGSRWGPLPGTDRESPILIAEAITELNDRFKFSKVYVAGYGMNNYCAGGINAIQLHSYFPQLVDGVIAMNAAVLIQCAPRDFKEPEIMARQRETPLVLLEVGKKSTKHRFSDTAFNSYRSCGFPAVRQIKVPAPQQNPGGVMASHAMDQAIEWLELISGNDSGKALALAEQLLDQNEIRQSIALLNAVDQQKLDAKLLASYELIQKKIAEGAKPAERFQKLLEANTYGDWFDEFLDFRLRYEYAPTAKACMSVFNRLRLEQEQPARDLIKEAGKLMKDDPKTNKLEANNKYREVIERNFASTQYSIAKHRLNPKPNN